MLVKTTTSSEFSLLMLAMSKKFENSPGYSASFWTALRLQSYPSKLCDAGAETSPCNSALPSSACAGSANRRYQRRRWRLKRKRRRAPPSLLPVLVHVTPATVSPGASVIHHWSSWVQCVVLTTFEESVWPSPSQWTISNQLVLYH